MSQEEHWFPDEAGLRCMSRGEIGDEMTDQWSALVDPQQSGRGLASGLMSPAS